MYPNKNNHPLNILYLGPRLRPRHRRLRRLDLRRPRLHAHRARLPRRLASLPRRRHRPLRDPRTRVYLPSQDLDVRFDGRREVADDAGGGGEIWKLGVCAV